MANPTSHSHHHRSRSGWASPERTVVWTEPPKHKQKTPQVVAVVYYLCRQDGQLEHPHFVHVPCLSDSDPPRLHLRDVTTRLSDLRGAAMPAAYSWSAKRTYRNGYVWHDLAADDLILPAQPHPNDEYVLKGSPLLLTDSTTTTTHPPQLPPPAARASCRKQQNKHNRWTSFDLADYQRANGGGAPAAELIGIDEISPPPSSSSPDDNALTLQQQQQEDGTPPAAGLIGGGGRMRASAMLMQLISCGSIKDHAGQGQQRRLPPRRVRSDAHCNNNDKGDDQRDYFSGSLVEKNSNRSGAIELRRSSSCNAGRGATGRLALGEGGWHRQEAAAAASRQIDGTEEEDHGGAS